MDVIFTTRPFLHEYGIIGIRGYDVVTNNVQIILDYIGDYSFQDYVDTNIYTFEKRVNEKWPDVELYIILNYKDIDDLLEAQWIEISKQKSFVDKEFYNELYLFLINLYMDGKENYYSDEELKDYLMTTFGKGGIRQPEYLESVVDVQ